MNIMMVFGFAILGGIIFIMAGNATAAAWFTAKWKNFTEDQCAARIVRLKKNNSIASLIFWLYLAFYIFRSSLGLKDLFFSPGIAGIAKIDVYFFVYLLVFATTIAVSAFAASSLRYYKKRFNKDPFTKQTISPE